MQVEEELWQKTKIETILSLFPNVLGEFLQSTTPQEIMRIEKFLPHIFWRWYMLEHPSYHTSPYHYLSFRKEKEHWPTDGQFFPKPAISITKPASVFSPQPAQAKITINIAVDYISFSEQPLITDVLNTLEGKPLQYRYDPQYGNAISQLVTVCKKVEMTPATIRDNPILLLESYFRQTLLAWQEQDPFINMAFTKNEWIAFWKHILHLSGQEKGLSTDNLLDMFVDIVRKTHPEYGIKSADLEKIKNEKDIDVQVKIQYFFWLSCAYYVLLPLSLFTHLVAPIFIEQQMFRKDLRELITHDFSDPMPIYAPFTTLTLTPFGKRFLKELGK